MTVVVVVSPPMGDEVGNRKERKLVLVAKRAARLSIHHRTIAIHQLASGTGGW